MPDTESLHAQLLRLGSEVNALRVDFDGRLEAIHAEVERRIGKSDATAAALHALDHRLDQLKRDVDAKLDRLLEAVGAADDTGGG